MINLILTPGHLHQSNMWSTDPPPNVSTAMSTLTISSPDNPSINPPRRKLAPHRKYAKKFLTLPDELLTNIVDNVTSEDLPNFRLTCKTLANIAAKLFGEKRLAHRRFIFTDYSLKGLVDMTAHPVFGPCIKSIMFGTDRLTNQLEVLMASLKSKKITDHTEAMRILQSYHERWVKLSKFTESPDLSRMLVTSLTNLSGYGTNVSLGIFNNDRRKRYYREVLTYGYGSSREFDDLPFAKFLTHNRLTLGTIRSACADANFHPEFFEFDLNGQEYYDGMEPALSRLLLRDEEFRSNFDVCIREGWTNILISPTRNLLDFKQRSTGYEEVTSAEHIRLQLSWLGSPMLTAFIAASITHFRMESCSMYSNDFIDLFHDLAETLQVVELIDVAIWGEQNYISSLFPVLHCLRDDLQLQRLVMDNLRATNKDYGGEPSGITVVVGRYWNGQRQIREGLNVLTGFDEYGLDNCKLDDWFERGIRSYERSLQRMNASEDEQPMDHTERRMDERVQLEEDLEHEKKEYAEYKATRAKVKEAMARVEAGDFST
jgi:hypothetical protein